MSVDHRKPPRPKQTGHLDDGTEIDQTVQMVFWVGLLMFLFGVMFGYAIKS